MTLRLTQHRTVTRVCRAGAGCGVSAGGVWPGRVRARQRPHVAAAAAGRGSGGSSTRITGSGAGALEPGGGVGGGPGSAGEWAAVQWGCAWHVSVSAGWPPHAHCYIASSCPPISCCAMLNTCGIGARRSEAWARSTRTCGWQAVREGWPKGEQLHTIPVVVEDSCGRVQGLRHQRHAACCAPAARTHGCVLANTRG